MLTNICTKDEVLFRFESFMLKQFTYDLDELRSSGLYQWAKYLLDDDADFWSDRSFWCLYDEALLLSSKGN